MPSKAQFVFTANATGFVRTLCNWYSAWRSVSLLKCSLSSSRLRSEDLCEPMESPESYLQLTLDVNIEHGGREIQLHIKCYDCCLG